MRFNVVPGTSQDVALKGLQQAAGDLQNSVAGGLRLVRALDESLCPKVEVVGVKAAS